MGENINEESWFVELSNQEKKLIKDLISAQKTQGDMLQLKPVPYNRDLDEEGDEADAKIEINDEVMGESEGDAEDEDEIEDVGEDGEDEMLEEEGEEELDEMGERVDAGSDGS